MGGSIRMSGIPYHPKDQVPEKHGGTDPIRIEENQPPDVTYGPDGLVHPQDLPKPAFVVPDGTSKLTDVYPYSKGTPVGKTVVTNAKTVSTETAAEARAAARSRKVQEK